MGVCHKANANTHKQVMLAVIFIQAYKHTPARHGELQPQINTNLKFNINTLIRKGNYTHAHTQREIIDSTKSAHDAAVHTPPEVCPDVSVA